MTKVFLSLCLLLFSCLLTRAQNQRFIKGRIIDTATTSILQNTSVSVLNAKDSTLLKFVRTSSSGNFEISNIPSGKYILLVSYPRYADFVDQFSLDSLKQNKDFGQINLTRMAKILQDVIIKGNRAAIKIKGDTTEFDPLAYNIEPNSKVEDLIRQFPGIQIDKDGKITAQGQTNVKVLVDGEEFFGDDPTLVTKNIRADMVDKVQLYDKKSDQATFTGVDDGEKTKTLNIKLKEDQKNGYFGKLNGGIGEDGFYKGEAMINLFRAKKKFSAYGVSGNTGQVGLGWGDTEKYASSALQFGDDGSAYIMGGGNDEFDSFDGRYNGQGIPNATTGGLHYDQKWNNDKESLNTNYKIGSIRVNGTRNTLNQNNLPGGVINSDANQVFDNDMFRQKLDATYEIKLDSTTNLKFYIDGTLKNSNTSDEYQTMSSRGDNTRLNRSGRSLINEEDDQRFNINVFITKRLQKKGRTLSLNLGQNSSTTKSNGYLNSANDFYDLTGLVIDSTQLVNQLKSNSLSNSAFNSNLVYTEPLSKTITAVVNYGLNLISGTSDRRSFNQSASGKFDLLDNEFSNNYELNQTVNQAGLQLNYKKDKTNISFGSKISGVNFRQDDLFNDIAYKRNFINYMPQATFRYRFSQQKALSIGYNGRTNQPSLNQIQPIRVNNDPLNIVLGNAELKPSFGNSIYANYNSYQVLSNQYIWISANYGFTADPIVSNRFTNASGVSTIRYDNLSAELPSNFNLNGSFSRKIKGLDIETGVYANVYGNTSYNFINDELNKSKSYNYSGGLSISKYKLKKYNFRISAGPSYNVATASIQQNANSSGWGLISNGSLNLQLPGKFEISTDGNYQFTGKTQTFNRNFERFIWNASLSRKFFKKEELRVSISGNDLLNQNVGFNRYASNGNITESNYTTIQRYFMFSLTWDFNKMGGTSKTVK